MNAKTHKLKPIATFHTHSWFVYAVAFSPDSKTLAAGTLEDVGFSLIDTKTWKVRRILDELDSPPDGVAFSPDSRSMIVPMGKESLLSCWDTNSGDCKWSFKPGSAAAVFSPNGRTVAATRGKELVLCDSRNGQVMHTLKGHPSRVDGAEFSTDGKRIVSVAGGEVILWDARSGAQMAVVQRKSGDINSISFSPSGKLLVVVGAKGLVRWYNGISGEMLSEVKAHEDTVWDAAFTPDGKRLVTADMESMRIWDAATRRELVSIPEGGPMVEVSPDGRYIASPGPDHTIGLWRTDNGKQAALMTKGGVGMDGCMAFSPNGLWLAATCGDEKTRVWAIKEALR